MTLSIYQVDAFTNGPFSGNPAAICPLQEWIGDDLMQKIAMENNLSETAFFVKNSSYYEIRWFTPVTEVDLCGHATLATAWLIFNNPKVAQNIIWFNSKSGSLSVEQKDNFYELNFPTDKLQIVAEKSVISQALSYPVKELFKGISDYVAVIDNQQVLEKLQPDFQIIQNLDSRGLIVTAPGSGEYDFVSRGFFPQCGVNEDPATGSAHSSLTPYWSKKLNKKKLQACQLSKRRGYFHCEDKGSRTMIAGKCRLFLEGTIYIE